jgi:hypothetical protein
MTQSIGGRNGRQLNPEGIASISPGLVAPATYPGYAGQPIARNSERVASVVDARYNPFRVGLLSRIGTQGRPLEAANPGLMD